MLSLAKYLLDKYLRSESERPFGYAQGDWCLASIYFSISLVMLSEAKYLAV
jgi:hypothetical protein